VTWLAEMGYYEMPVDRHPLREGVRDNTNHYVTGRDGGRDIDLRRFAEEGMQLFGRLVGYEEGALRFEPNLAQHLDEADRIYNGINASIDRWIEQRGIAAPPPSVYTPLWQPERERETASLREHGVGSVLWCIGFRPDFGWLDAPVFDGHGNPQHRRGVTAQPGLYFIGLPWLHTWGSGRFSAVSADAAYLAGLIHSKAVDPQAVSMVAP
jgi:putative flavoprotein involved in K+ transport